MNAAPLQASFAAAEPYRASAGEPATINATPFRWPDQRDLPRRPWVWGRWLLRSTVSAIVAPGGVGKPGRLLAHVIAGAQEVEIKFLDDDVRSAHQPLEDRALRRQEFDVVVERHERLDRALWQQRG